MPTWSALGLMPELSAAVKKLGFATPSTPQLLAVPPLLAGKSVAFASSTGSGKTLAFLLPIMQQMRQQELMQPLLAQGNRCRPRAIVLAPTRDLTTQIGQVAKTLAHEFRVRVRTAEGSMKLSQIRMRLRDSGADMIVATPDRLKLLRELGDVSMREVRHVVVDEADDMMLRGFGPSLRELFSKMPMRTGDPPSPQLAFVSATLGADVRHVLRNEHPDLEFLIGKCAHRAPSSLTHEILHYQGDKMVELKKLLREGDEQFDGMLAASSSSSSSVPRTLVFCRGVQSARAVQHSLSEAGLPVGGCHGSMPDEMRRHDLKAFLEEPPSKPLLVCTDLTARGMDFPTVPRVVNFDFPATSSLYLHRAGRTARMGRKGHVVSLVHDSERRFAESIRDAVQRKSELHTVRKGDLRERKRASGPREQRGRAAARALIGQQRDKLVRMAQKRRRSRS